MEARKFNPNDHLIQLKGKDYLQVMWRLVWFREDKPLWAITTQMIAHDTEAKLTNMQCMPDSLKDLFLINI